MENIVRDKRGELLNRLVVHVILVGIIFAIFLTATGDKINARGVRQQVLEKQFALLIDSAQPGMNFTVEKENVNGIIDDVRISGGRIFVDVEGLHSLKGYPYFSLYNARVVTEEKRFTVVVEK